MKKMPLTEKRMYKSLMIVFIFMAIAGKNVACEICGCSTGNFQIGLLPNFSKGFLGFRYSAAQFSSHLRGDNTQFSRDRYSSMELWGGHNFKKFQVMAFLPYLFIRKLSDDGTTNTRGAGDLMVLVNYKVLTDTRLMRREKVRVRNDLFIGGGVKLPTGVNRVNTAAPGFTMGDFNSQAGTGSMDYIIAITHNLSWNRSGFVTNIAYRFNTANRQNYRFGNRGYLNSAYYYTFTTFKTKIKPNVGVSYQHNDGNVYHGSSVQDSHGYNLNSTLGINFVRDAIGVNAMAYIPLIQDIYDGQTKLKSRIILGLTYSF